MKVFKKKEKRKGLERFIWWLVFIPAFLSLTFLLHEVFYLFFWIESQFRYITPFGYRMMSLYIYVPSALFGYLGAILCALKAMDYAPRRRG